jgi:gluconolactonase
MRNAAPLFLVFAIACSSETPAQPPPGGGDASPDTGAVVDGGGGGSDAGVEGGPDWSNVDPIEGVVAADVKEVKGGYAFTEGTAWNAAGGFLLFSDIPNNKIHRLDPPSTVIEFRADSGKSNGLTWAPDGKLVACEHFNRRVSRSNADGSGVVTVVDAYMGKKLNSPNDVIIRSDGVIYFTDPDYGLEGRTKEQTFNGVYRVDRAGAIHLVDSAMTQPNGIALSPDQKVLYVGDSAAARTVKWNVEADGTLSGRVQFVGSGSDGIAIDDAGNVYLTSGGQVRVFRPNGQPWGNIPIPRNPTNAAFGGADRKTLYVSAQSAIYAVRLKVPGLP